MISSASFESAADRASFLRDSAGAAYGELTGGLSEAVRVEDLVFRAADRFPGLVPGRDEIAAERELPQSRKRGVEVDQGLFLSRVLADPRAGRHLVHAMLRPRREALDMLDGFRRTARADLGPVLVERRGSVGHVELRNLSFLNAEDGPATSALETAVDLVLLDPGCEVGVLRGGVVDHPRHAGRRVFNSGLNLTHLYYGQISAERGSYFNLPARKEGIVPGVSPRRLTRMAGDRLARQAIMFDRTFEPASPEGRLLCDEVVEPGGMDAAIERDAAQLVSSGVVSASANRKAIRLGQETVDELRQYLAVYAREQARCMYSPALIRNLEEYWRAHERTLPR